MGLYGASEHTYWQSTCEVKTNLQRIGKIFAIIFLRFAKSRNDRYLCETETMCEMQRCVCKCMFAVCIYLLIANLLCVYMRAMPVNYLCCAISSLSVLHQLLKSVWFRCESGFQVDRLWLIHQESKPNGDEKKNEYLYKQFTNCKNA